MNVWDHRACPDAAQAVVTAANRLGRWKRVVAWKMNARSRFVGRARFRFPPSGQPREIPSARRGAPSPGPSQKPLDGRNLATISLVAPKGALGRMPPDSGGSLPVFKAGSRAAPSEPGPFPGRSLNAPRLLAPPRGRLSILRSTSRRPIDERRCRRSVPPNPPRVRRGARPRSGRRWPRSPRVDA
jgi:hypothetical protein